MKETNSNTVKIIDDSRQNEIIKSIKKELLNSLKTHDVNNLFTDRKDWEIIVDSFLNSIYEIEFQGEIKYRKAYISTNTLKGKTIKLKNLKVNLKDFFEAIATATVTATGIVTFPWIAPLGVLVFLNQIFKSLTLEISEKEGKILWVMWHIYTEKGKNKINNNEIKKTMDMLSFENHFHSITKDEINEGVYKLEVLGCIKKLKNSNWKIIEKVKVSKK